MCFSSSFSFANEMLCCNRDLSVFVGCAIYEEALFRGSTEKTRQTGVVVVILHFARGLVTGAWHFGPPIFLAPVLCRRATANAGAGQGSRVQSSRPPWQSVST